MVNAQRPMKGFSEAPRTGADSNERRQRRGVFMERAAQAET
jgi:hypothetical protein